MDSACHLGRIWLDDCTTSHTTCHLSREPRLPTRVLHLSGTVGAPTIKLIKTTGLEARYCALSHCSGPVDKMPLSTTRESYHKHVAGIPNEQLPKTFRETIALVLGIGINYVWIDSLCIIQNDEADWHAEALCIATTPPSIRTLQRNAVDKFPKAIRDVEKGKKKIADNHQRPRHFTRHDNQRLSLACPQSNNLLINLFAKCHIRHYQMLAHAAHIPNSLATIQSQNRSTHTPCTLCRQCGQLVACPPTWMSRPS
jgi:hypothetical protein